MSDFVKQFLDRTGHSLNIIEAAIQGKTPDWLSTSDIATLIAPIESRSSHFKVCAQLRAACQSGELSAREYRRSAGGDKGGDSIRWYVHRDEARRHFQRIGVFPEKNSPLWHWLRGWRNPDQEKPTVRERDKTDFQQLCTEDWAISTKIRITGKNGMARRLCTDYFLQYGIKTLEAWAREVAPPEVKGKLGRSRKEEK